MRFFKIRLRPNRRYRGARARRAAFYGRQRDARLIARLVERAMPVAIDEVMAEVGLDVIIHGMGVVQQEVVDGAMRWTRIDPRQFGQKVELP